MYQRGLKVSGIEYIEAIAAAHAAGRKMAAFLTSHDVILSTTLAGPPPKLGYFDQNGDVQSFAERVTEYLSVTSLHNATGAPAMNVPLHWTADGLPVGVHFAGRYGEEATLLALAAQQRRNHGSIACRRCKERMEPIIRSIKRLHSLDGAVRPKSMPGRLQQRGRRLSQLPTALRLRALRGLFTSLRAPARSGLSSSVRNASCCGA